jgi:FkbM family methyltransferase
LIGIMPNETAILEHKAPRQRHGHIAMVGAFEIFVDDANYSLSCRQSLDSGTFEARERALVTACLRPGDRVIELGTAVGVVASTAAAITGAANVLTFEANPYILADARANFARNRMPEIAGRHAVLANRRLYRPNATTRFHLHRDFWASRLDASEGQPGVVQSLDVPVRSLEQEIAAHGADVLICDIEGGEVALLTGADLSGIRMIILETHYWAVGEALTDAMMRNLIMQGFSLHLRASGQEVLLLRRA